MTYLIGLDAASKHDNFGVALGIHDSSGVRIVEAGLLGRSPAISFERLAAFIKEAPARVLVAVDAPLGWPRGLSGSLAQHQAGNLLFEGGSDALFKRATDMHVRAKTKKNPLEVGADKIARASHSALRELHRLRLATGRDLPMVWGPDFEGSGVIEVYPAATLAAKSIPAKGYKKEPAVTARKLICQHLVSGCPELEAHAGGTDHVFDACLCLVAGADFLDGKCDGPTDRLSAEREGWIWFDASRFR